MLCPFPIPIPLSRAGLYTPFHPSNRYTKCPMTNFIVHFFFLNVLLHFLSSPDFWFKLTSVVQDNDLLAEAGAFLRASHGFVLASAALSPVSICLIAGVLGFDFCSIRSGRVWGFPVLLLSHNELLCLQMHSSIQPFHLHTRYIFSSTVIS